MSLSQSKTLGQITVFLLLSLASFATAAPLNGTVPGRNAQDIAIIDRALATFQSGQDYVVFGDVGVKPEVLKIFRDRLVAEQEGASSPTPT